MGTRMFLVRHGATELSKEDRFAGEVNVQLSESGRTQVRSLAKRLAGEKLSAIYASPLDRTMETARILAEPHGLPVLPRPGLREISHGHWEGKARAEVASAFPQEYARWESDPYSFAPKDGETGLAVTARALPAVLEMVAAHPLGNVLVVSHKATIRLLLSSVLGFDPRTYRDRLDQNPACLNILDFSGPTRARLTLFNDVSHYGPTGATLPPAPSGRLSSWWADPPPKP